MVEISHVAAINQPKDEACQVGSCLDAAARQVEALQFVATVTAMSVDDLRSGIHAASSNAGRSPDAATERSAFGAAVVPLRPLIPTYPDQRLAPERLHQIDRAFFGPFFTEKYGMAGDRALENSRIRYYGAVQTAHDAGELVGRRYVHEFDTMTGCTRGWHETLDRAGNVRQVRPERNDGIVRHYQFDGNGRYRGSW